jgi:hypothetical protein
MNIRCPSNMLGNFSECFEFECLNVIFRSGEYRSLLLSLSADDA